MRNLKGVLATGFFRTGSTFFFSCMRQAEGLKCFYEPYHPEIHDYVEMEQQGLEAVDNNALRHTVEESYFLEYRDIDIDRMREAFGPSERITNHPVLAASSRGENLKRYIDFLLGFAAQSRSIPLLQANRFNLMIPWLKKRYPDYLIVLLTRNPRDVYLSLRSLASRQNIDLESRDVQAINFWNVKEIFGEIITHYDLRGYGLWNFDYYQMLYFSMRFIERYMGRHADMVIDYRDFCNNYIFWIKTILDSIGVNPTASTDYTRSSLKAVENEDTQEIGFLEKESRADNLFWAILSDLSDY